MRFLAWEMLTPSPELKTLEGRKTDRFREHSDLLPQNSLKTYKVKTPDFGKPEKKLSRKGTTQEREKKPPEMNILSP